MKPIPIYSRKSHRDKIRSCFEQGRRIVMLGLIGSGRTTTIKKSLSGVKTVEVNLACVYREADLDRIAVSHGLAEPIHGAFGIAVNRLEKSAAKQPTALIIRNIDGCEGSPHETGVMGRLRSQVQFANDLRVFYTACSPTFLERHFSASNGAFNRQAEICPLPPFSVEEIADWMGKIFGRGDHISSASLIDSVVGGRPANLSPLFEELKLQGGAGLKPRSIEAAAGKIALSRRLPYEKQFRDLPARQRAVLHAIALGVAPHAGPDLEAATGIPAGTLCSVLKNLVTNRIGFRVGSDFSFYDPYFRIFLAKAE